MRYSLTSCEFNMTLILETSTFLYERVRSETMTEKKVHNNILKTFFKKFLCHSQRLSRQYFAQNPTCRLLKSDSSSDQLSKNKSGCFSIVPNRLRTVTKRKRNLVSIGKYFNIKNSTFVFTCLRKLLKGNQRKQYHRWVDFWIQIGD